MEDNPPRYSEPAKSYFADTASEEVKDYFEQLLDDKIITDRELEELLEAHGINS